MSVIKLKSNDTAGKVPLPSELINGELAINTADGKLYTKVGSNVVMVKTEPVVASETQIGGAKIWLTGTTLHIDL